MRKFLIGIFFGDMTYEEKQVFLSKVMADPVLRKEFIRIKNVL